MKRRSIVALSLVALVAAAVAATTSASTKRAASNTLTVWLQTDAQSGWPDVVAAANQQFENDNPGWTVNVQYQTWGDHLSKLDSVLAAGGGSGSLVLVEMGNTETTSYMAAGAFANLSSAKSSFANSSSWLSGLAKSGTYGGKLFAVPYYAGSRVITYRTDLFKKAGITKLPNSTAAYAADAAKLFKVDKKKGLLESKQSIAGLTAYKNFFNAVSRASKTTDESHPNPYDVYAQGQTGSIEGPSWFSCCVGKQYTADTGQFVMPGHVAGTSMLGFLGGSDLAVPVTSGSKTQAIDWIKDFTSTSSEKALQAKGNIPNATNLLGNSVNERAAARSWFVPQAKHWVDVENGNILRNMLAQILTGHLTIKQAAQSADDNIASVLNQP